MIDDAQVVGAEWDKFIAWFATVWEQGQHIALIGPTGCGKTTCAVGLTKIRKYVVALDAKGGDGTLEKSGFQQLTDWPPPRKVLKDIAEGRPARLRVGFPLRELKDKPILRQLMGKVLDHIWVDGGWTVEIDELQILADRKLMNHGGPVEEMLIAARDKKISVLTAFQAPAWVPTAATRQATWIVIFPTRDITVIKALAEKIGRDWHVLKDILHALPDHHCVVAGLNPRDPLVLTCPAEV